MNPRRKQRLIITASMFAGFGLIIGLILYAAGENMDLFYTPNEIVNGKNETGVKPKVGERLRIGGMVVPGSVVRDDKTLDVRFDLIDDGARITVVYQGLLPDLFREGQGIITEGKLDKNLNFIADIVLAKHDENYKIDHLEGYKEQI